MKNTKYHTVETVSKSKIKIIKRGQFDTPYTQIHDRSLSWFGTGTSIKIGLNKRQRKPQGKSRMDNPEKLSTWVHKTQDEGNQNKNTIQHVMDTTMRKQTHRA